MNKENSSKETFITEKETVKETTATAKPKKRKRRIDNETRKKLTKILVFLAFLILFSLAGMYLFKGYQNRHTFFHGVMINGMDVSGKTVDEVEEMLKEKTENYVLHIIGRENTTAAISKEDVDFKYISDGSVQKYFDNQNWWAWGLSYLKIDRERFDFHVIMEYNQQKLHNLVYSWDFVNSENQKDPTDAYLSHQNGKYVIVEEYYGNRMNSEIFYQAIQDAISKFQTELLIDDTGTYTNPNIYADDPVLNKNMETLNTYASCTITYNLPYNQTTVLTPEIMQTWLQKDIDGYYHMDEALWAEKVSAFVNEMNKLVEDANTKEVIFMGQLGEEQSVKNYIDRKWTLDVEKELAQLTAELKANQDVTREPVYSSRILNENGKLGDTYVEIDMSAQHLWYYENGELVVESDIVSGTYTDTERRTPEGLYELAYKQRDRILLGAPDEQGIPSYESPVDYWMPFNGAIGMHDADNWRSRYGGTIYKYGGSHGCINMPGKKAGILYKNIEKGCPVVCYY